MKSLSILLMLLIVATSTFAQVSVKVFSKDEALTENNMSKPRIYIQNTGSSALSDFIYQYKFNVENGKTPILEDFYTPNSNISLINLGNDEYILEYSFAGVTLNPGQVLPNMDGNVVGIRYSDWSFVDKTNDFSNLMNSSFIENSNILVYDGSGNLIYGSSSASNILPIANAGNDVVVQDDGNGVETISLDGSSSYDVDGIISSYVWTENGTMLLSTAKGDISLPVGCHSVILTVTDNDGAVSTDEIIVNIISKNTEGFDLEVYSKQTGLSEDNITKPRVYIKNNGNRVVNGFSYYYYITADEAKNIILEDWYSPLSNVTLEDAGEGLMKVKYDYSDVTLNPGQIIPNNDGNSIGLHNSDYSTIDKTDDFSFINSDVFVLNDHIPVYDINNMRIYGLSPKDLINTGKVDVTIESMDLDNNPLGAMSMKIKINNNSNFDLDLSGKQLYYYFNDASEDLALTLSDYKLDGNATNIGYLEGNLSYRNQNSAVRVDIKAGTIDAFGYAEFTITVTRTTGSFDENNDWSYLMSSGFVENNKIVLMNEKDVEFFYGNSPTVLNAYGAYDLSVSPNPVPADRGYVTISYTLIDNATARILIQDENGNEVYYNNISNEFNISTNLFNKNQIYNVYLIADGEIVGASSFIELD